MAQQKYYTILTEVGKSKIANATVLNEKVQFSKMQLGDGGGSQYEPHEKQTELKNKVWEGSISNVKVDENNSNWIVVETAIPGNSGGFTVREVGLFDDAGELLAVGKYPETYKPVVDDGCVKDLFVRVILMVVNTSAITLKIDPTVILASMKDLNDLRKEVSAKIDTAKTELNSKIDEVRSDLDSIELTAEKVSVKDTENNFTSVNTEGVLQELVGKDKNLDAKIDSTRTDLTNQYIHFTGEINNLKQSVSSGKELIATAVTGKDVPTNGSDTFKQMADNIDSIETKLPILEGNVGVTEDNEGNVYGVDKIEERQTYFDMNKLVFSSWLYAVPSPRQPRDVVVDSQGCVYSVNYNINAGGYVFKLSPDGDELWRYAMNYGVSVTVDDDDCIYACSNDSTNGKVIKLSSEGELVWECSLIGSLDVVVDSQGYVYVVSYYGLSKLNSDGELVWSYGTNFSSVEVDNKGFIYVFGNNGTESGLLKLSPERDLLWVRKDTGILSITSDLYGFVYINRSLSSGGEHQVIKINSEGETVWSYYHVSTRSAVVDNLGYVYSCSNYDGNGMLIKLTPNGEAVWKATSVYANAIDIDNKGYVYTSNYSINATSSLIQVKKFKDNYTLEKLAVLIEREATE